MSALKIPKLDTPVVRPSEPEVRHSCLLPIALKSTPPAKAGMWLKLWRKLK